MLLAKLGRLCGCRSRSHLELKIKREREIDGLRGAESGAPPVYEDDSDQGGEDNSDHGEVGPVARIQAGMRGGKLRRGWELETVLHQSPGLRSMQPDELPKDRTNHMFVLHEFSKFPLGLCCESIVYISSKVTSTVVVEVHQKDIPQEVIGMEVVKVNTVEVIGLQWNAIIDIVQAADFPIVMEFRPIEQGLWTQLTTTAVGRSERSDHHAESSNSSNTVIDSSEQPMTVLASLGERRATPEYSRTQSQTSHAERIVEKAKKHHHTTSSRGCHGKWRKGPAPLPRRLFSQ